MTTDFYGNLAVTGTIDVSDGEHGTFKGNFGIVLSATLDASGNGTATEIVTGSVILYYDGSSSTIPFNFTKQNIPFQLGHFSGTTQIPGPFDFPYGITVSGTVSSDLHTINENVTVVANGTYQGYSFHIALNASGTLIAPYAPTITGVAAGQTTLDVTPIKPFQNVTIGDINPGTVTVTVTMSSAANGTFTNLGGGSYNSNLGVYTVTGSAAQVTAALDALIFNPTVHQAPGGQTISTGFKIQVGDTSHGSASDNTTTVITTETGLGISGTAAQLATTDVLAIKPFQNAVFTDTTPGATPTLTVTLSAAANGSFSNLGGGSYNAVTGIYTITGTAGQITAALHDLTFNPTLQQAPQGAVITTSFALHATDTAGADLTINNTFVNTTETGPVINGTVSNQQKFDFASIKPFQNVIISDPISTRVETVTVTNYAFLTGSFSNLGGGTYNPSTGVYTVTGTPAQVTAALEGLVLDSMPYHPVVGETINGPFRIHVTNNAGGLADDVTTNVITLTTGPSISGLSSNMSVTTIDTLGAMPFKNAVLTDTNPNAIDTVTVYLLYQPNGALSSSSGGTFNVPNSRYTFTGTAAQVTAALQNLKFDPAMHLSAGGQTVNTTLILDASNSAGAEDNGSVYINIATMATGPTLTTIATFSGANGRDLVADAGGNLFGLTRTGGTNNFGTIFKIAKTPTGYAGSPTTLFNATYSGQLNSDLIVDAAGNLLGTTTYNGGANPGSAFALLKTGNSYANSLTALATFSTAQHVSPKAGLVADAAGNLFGATAPGTSTPGTVFMIAKTPGGYASSATTLYTFGGITDGEPNGDLFVDADGNLFGTTKNGGTSGLGSIFEIVKTAGVYASTPMTLASFDGTAGVNPIGNLIMDADRNLYGTTLGGSSAPGYSDPVYMVGKLFQLAKTPGGYAAAIDPLVDFGLAPSNNPLDWGGPYRLAIDADGNIFGTAAGGIYGTGKIFELARAPGGYPAIPTTLHYFSNSNNNYLYPNGLIVDSAGNLYTSVDAASGGAAALVKLRHTGYQTGQGLGFASDFDADGKSELIWQNADGTPVAWFLNGGILSSSGIAGANPGTSWHVKGTGDFDGNGQSDLVLQNDNGAVSVWLMNGTTLVNGGSPGNPGTKWQVMATGDFNGDGKSDILLQSDDGQLSSWLMNGTAMTSGGSPGNPGTDRTAVATGDFNDDGISDVVLQKNNGQVSIWYMNGISLLNSEVSANPGSGWHVRAAGDFNGDGYSDLVLQHNNGQAAIWLMYGAQVPISANLTNPGASWHVKGTGDFDGDGKSDLIWQTDTGQASIWLMDGTTVKNTYAAGPAVGTAWQIANEGFNPDKTIKPPRGDLNGDGLGDLLLQNDNGQIAVWLMNGGTKISSGSPANPGPSWHAKATGDFDGDGMADILLQNDNGQASIWFMNGTALASGVAAGPNPGTAWKVTGAGDFDSDSKADILLQNDNGQMSIWFMNGGTLASGVAAGPNPGPAWHAVATGDFDGDGKSDILLQNDNGLISAWLMNGGNLSNGAAVGSNPGQAWHVRGAADMDGDGKSDILLQNDNGQASIWFMNGTTLVSGVAAGPNPGSAWTLKGGADLDGDGMSELIWQGNASGQVSAWFMAGPNLLNGSTIGAAAGSQWHVVAAGR